MLVGLADHWTQPGLIHPGLIPFVSQIPFVFTFVSPERLLHRPDGHAPRNPAGSGVDGDGRAVEGLSHILGVGGQWPGLRAHPNRGATRGFQSPRRGGCSHQLSGPEDAPSAFAEKVRSGPMLPFGDPRRTGESCRGRRRFSERTQQEQRAEANAAVQPQVAGSAAIAFIEQETRESCGEQ